MVGDSHATNNCGLSLANAAVNSQKRGDFKELDVRMPYDKWKARLISIRDSLSDMGSELAFLS